MSSKLSKLIVITLVALLMASNAAITLAASPEEQSDQTIVDIAVADGRFTTLVAALQAADLVDTLNGEGPFTVFAPTDDAFAALPEGTVDALLADIPALTNVLLYHVVPGKVLAADVVNLPSADTALGEPVEITVDGSTVRANDAQVIITDIEASNGVIHVIDAVLNPPEAAASQSDQTELPKVMAVPMAQQGHKYYGGARKGHNTRYNRYGYRNHNRGYYGNGYGGRNYYSGRNYNRGHYGKSYYGGRNYNRGYYGQSFYGGRNHNRAYYGQSYFGGRHSYGHHGNYGKRGYYR